MAEPRIAFKAGRAFRREGTNTVAPSATKGAIILQNGDDGLLHFIWKNRASQNVEEVCLEALLNEISLMNSLGSHPLSGRRELCKSTTVSLGKELCPQVLVIGPETFRA